MTLAFDFHPLAQAEFAAESLTIVAVAHAKRRPGYWRERIVSTDLRG